MENINKKFLLLIFFIGIIVLIINIFFYQICVVHGDSMYPTLKNNNIILMKKYNLQLERNDIVVIKKDDTIIIKRLVGLPGDNVYIENYLYVNGEKFDNLITEEKGILENEILLGEDGYFVLGDNRQNSTDSRDDKIGIIKKDQIIGKVLFK